MGERGVYTRATAWGCSPALGSGQRSAPIAHRHTDVAHVMVVESAGDRARQAKDDVGDGERHEVEVEGKTASLAAAEDGERNYAR